ncbi:MAG TPA: Gfo/Idh/MocA family oxidoreductase [Actinomycetota bacterium]
MRPVRWGVLSTAKIAVEKVIPGMRTAERCDLVAIASRDPALAGEWASRLGIPKAHGSYEALLADPDVEAVYIPLPNHLHAEWTMRAAEAGKHVLCEKPLALSSEQAQEMIEACRNADVLLMEAFMYRVHPQWVRVREIVSSGRLGELLVVEGFFSYRNLDPHDIRNIADYGGGALMDIGCYPINVARMMFGAEPSGVKAFLRRDPSFGTDVLTTAVLDFGGRHATFTCSTQLENDQRVHLIGTQGRLLVEIPFNIPPDRATRLFFTAGGDPPVAPNTEIIEIPPADPYGVQIDGFSRAVVEGGEAPLSTEDSVANMRVIERVVAAAEG